MAGVISAPIAKNILDEAVSMTAFLAHPFEVINGSFMVSSAYAVIPVCISLCLMAKVLMNPAEAEANTATIEFKKTNLVPEDLDVTPDIIFLRLRATVIESPTAEQ